MSPFAKTALLSIGLVTGVAFAAQAQSNNVAALPPAAPAAGAPAASGAMPGTNPGGGWYGHERQSQDVRPSANKTDGPSPGGGWYASEKQTQDVQPSGNMPGPRAN